MRGSSPRITSVGKRIAMYYCQMMRNRRNSTKNRAGEIGRVRVIEDFLPAPADLVPREENVKVTLSLSRRSLDFFKREAKKRRVPYQRMIRALVDTYAERQVGGKAR